MHSLSLLFPYAMSRFSHDAVHGNYNKCSVILPYNKEFLIQSSQAGFSSKFSLKNKHHMLYNMEIFNNNKV